jgi:hypothetical protein
VLAEAIQKKPGPFVSYFCTRKGESRTERLKHYSHRAMALLLESDPDILAWTTEVEPLTVRFEGSEHEFTPHFLATSKAGPLAFFITLAKKIQGKRLDFYMTVTATYAERGVRFRFGRECDMLANPRRPAASAIRRERTWRAAQRDAHQDRGHGGESAGHAWRTAPHLGRRRGNLAFHCVYDWARVG